MNHKLINETFLETNEVRKARKAQERKERKWKLRLLRLADKKRRLEEKKKAEFRKEWIDYQQQKKEEVEEAIFQARRLQIIGTCESNINKIIDGYKLLNEAYVDTYKKKIESGAVTRIKKYKSEFKELVAVFADACKVKILSVKTSKNLKAEFALRDHHYQIKLVDGFVRLDTIIYE
jgi:hypothetical protein